MSSNNGVNYFARGLVGYQETDIGIAQPDRQFMFYTLGRTGTGKSTMLHNMIAQDLVAGRGMALIDPHGDLAQAVLALVPKQRKNDVIYLNAADLDYPIGLNVLELSNGTERHLLAVNLIGVFKKIWADSWGPRMEYVLHNTLLALLENPSSTLLDVNKLLIDEQFRSKIVQKVNDPVVREYWEKEFSGLPERFRAEVVSPIQNKIGAYLTNGPLRNMLGQPKCAINFDQLINNNGILIANLSKGKLGQEPANLLGSLLVTKLQLAAMARVDIPEPERQDFHLYVDEFHNFTTQSFADMLAEVRKYGLNLILANQYLDQLAEGVKNAVLANAGTLVVFRLGPKDAKILEQEFEPHYSWVDLVNLSPYEVRYKLMQDGQLNRPWTATTLPPLQPQYEGYKEDEKDPEKHLQDIIEQSRQRYSRPRELVERRIRNKYGRPMPLLSTAIDFEKSKKTPVTTFSIYSKS